MIRVVVVDDQPLIRAGVARILSAEDGFEVVGECADGDEVAATVAHAKPDVVLMDIRMPRLDGASATRQLRDSGSDAPPVLILTTFDDDDALWGALEAGASGFILKDTAADEMIAATRAVAGSAAWLDPKVAGRVLTSLRGNGRSVTEARRRLGQLTEREHDVLRHMARGASNREIARALHVSEATVKSHISSIFSKLAVRDRAAAIVFAYDRGIVTPDRRGHPDTGRATVGDNGGFDP